MEKRYQGKWNCCIVADCWTAGLLDCWTAGLLDCWTAGLLHFGKG